MPSRVSIAALCTATLFVGVERLALAQAPGQTGPSEYHAVPPLPEVLPSPRPSLPPPSRLTRGESVGGFITFGSGGFDTIIGEDGSIRFDDNHIGGGIGINPLVGPVAVITFDITDEVMRWAGQDPYLTQKLQIMDSTREERMVARRRHDKVVMRRALDDLPSYLAAVWGRTDWSPALRRRVLFALWDEAAEEGNELLRAGGAEARRTIEGFIASVLPPGTRHAFGEDELAQLNHLRTSRQAFMPYREPDAAPSEMPDDGAPTLVAAALRGL